MLSSRTLVGALVAALAVSLVTGASGAPSPDLTRNLRAGGLVVVLRHAATDFSKPDQDPVVVADCATQRNLSAPGRADARAIGRGMRLLGLPLGKVLSSPYCRTLETARLAFGRATVHPALLNTIAAEHDAAWRKQIRDARRLLGTRPAPGKLTVLVTHSIVVQETTGQTLEEGEAIVFRPLGSSRFRVIGRVLPREWGGRSASPPPPRRPVCASRSIRSQRGRTRTTWRWHPMGRSGTRPSTPASSAGSTRRRGRRQRSRSGRARRRTASSSGRTARRG